MKQLVKDSYFYCILINYIQFCLNLDANGEG